MKSQNITTHSILVFILLFISARTCEAHFGSKGPYGGSVSCMAVNDTMIYVGTSTGGVYESTNSLLTAWRPRPVGLKNGNIHALAHTGSYLFTATDSGVYRFTGYDGNDRYWEKFNNGLPSNNVTSFLALDSITLLAGLDGDGVYKTTDNGVTWVASNTGVQSFVISGFAKSASRLFHISDGVWFSDDNGQTWNDFNDLNTDNIEATEISYNSVSDQLLVYNTTGLFIVDTASVTLTPVYVSALANLPVGIVVSSITNDGSNWYISTNQGIYSSPAGTINWTGINSGIATDSTTAIGFLPVQNVLVTGTFDWGIYKSPASGIVWSSFNNGFNNLVTHSMITSGTTLVVAATEKGLFVSNDLATSYAARNSGLNDSLNVSDVDFFGPALIAVTMHDGVFVSADTGLSWQSYNTGLVNLSVLKVFASSSFVYIIDSAGSVFQSDMVTGWTLIQTGLPSGVRPSSMTFFNGNILLGTMGDGVYMRPESSGTWVQNNAGLTNLNVTSVTVNNQNKIFAGTDGNGVFVSDNVSVNWTSTAPLTIPFTTMLGLDVNNVQAMGFNAGYVYAAVRGQVVATSDNGATWIEAGTQFNLPSYADLRKISFVTTRLFTYTPNNCLYSQGLSELPPLSVNEVEKNSGVNIFPNPVNGALNFEFSNIFERALNIHISDMNGKVVAEFNKPDHLVKFEAPSGMYILKITTGSRVINQKIIVE